MHGSGEAAVKDRRFLKHLAGEGGQSLSDFLELRSWSCGPGTEPHVVGLPA